MKKTRLIHLLKQLRLDANLTQIELGEILGQTQSYVSKYESGEQRLDLMEIEAICLAVGTPLIEFVERYLESQPSLPKSK
jgi:transcriptional regulator with XRE-family HTH domain